MAKFKKLSKSFFEKERPVAPKNSLKDVIPFRFSNDEKVKKGDYKNKKIIKLTSIGYLDKKIS